MTSTRTTARARSVVATALVLGLAALGVVSFPLAASATTYAVTSTADAGPNTLRAAVILADANAGPDTITFALPANSTIVLLSTINITEGLTIDGSGAPGLVVTGSGGSYLLLTFAPATPNQDFSSNDIIFDGTAGGGAPAWQGVALYMSIGAGNDVVRSLTLTRITGKNINSGAFEGPALYVFATQANGSITVSDSTFSNNSSHAASPGGGGALFFRGTHGLVTVSGSTFTGNSALSGGAIFVDGTGGGVPDLTVMSSTFTNNTATGAGAQASPDGDGGAVFANVLGTVVISGSTFTGNTTSQDGGAVAIAALQVAADGVTMTSSSFLSNHAVTGGGAFWSATTVGDISVTGSTFSSNGLSDGDGFTPLGNSIQLTGTGNHGLTILNSTLDEAAAAFSSYAVAVNTTGTSPLSIAHSTIVGPGALAVDTLGGVTSAISHSILWDLGAANDAVFVQSYGTNTFATSWNLSSGTNQPYLAAGAGNHFSVASFGLGVLANNGGPTLTRLPDDSSPAHNDGNPAIVGAPATDQRGLTRIVQTIDIGAVEIQAPGLAATGITVTPRLPLTATLLILLGALAVVYSRRRSAGAHRP